MKKRVISGILALLLLSPVSAYMLSDYPALFFEDDQFTAAIVKGSQRDSAEITAANLIINNLPRAGRVTPRDMPVPYYRYRAEPVPSTTIVEDRNAPGTDEIVIGTPCANSRVRQLLNITQCKTYFAQPQGLLLLLEDEHKHLIITGSDGSRVLDAAKILTTPRYRMQLRTTNAPIRRVQYRTAYQIGSGRELLDIGQTIGAVTPAIYTGHPYTTYQPYYPQNGFEYVATPYGTIAQKSKGTRRQQGYLRFPDGSLVTN